MTEQFSLFDLMHLPAIRRAVDPDGPVIQSGIDEVLTLPNGRHACPMAEIELHRHTDGLFMWATSYQIPNLGGSGYRVGEKWGKFAQSREDALHYAKLELSNAMDRRHFDNKYRREISAWMEGLK